MTTNNHQAAVRKIGWDPGHGGSKAAEVQMVTIQGVTELQIVTSAIPAVVGIGSTTSTGALNLAGIVRGGRERSRPHVVTFDGQSYLAGEAVERYARPIERMDFARFVDGPETRALLYATLWPLIDGGSHSLAIAVALPVEILLDPEQARQTEDGMHQWMVGHHAFAVNGAPAEMDITQVRARVAQPVAGWFDWGLTNTGQWTRGTDAAKAPTLIVDIGFNTLDLVAIEGGKISTRYTGGDNLGMRRSAEAIASTIQQRYGLELSLHEADVLTRQVTNGQKAHVFVEGQAVEVTSAVRQAVQAHGSEVVRFVEQRVDNARRFRVLCLGGGALALGERIRRQWPHTEIAPDPVTANARGLAKLARRAGYLD